MRNVISRKESHGYKNNYQNYSCFQNKRILHHTAKGYCANDSGYFNVYYPPTTTAFKDIAAIWYYNENITYRYACVSNAQKESTGTQTACLKVWDKNNRTDSKIYPSGAFIRLNGLTVWKAKTRGRVSVLFCYHEKQWRKDMNELLKINYETVQ